LEIQYFRLYHTHSIPLWDRKAGRQEDIRDKVRVATAEIEEEVRQQYRVVSTCASQNVQELLACQNHVIISPFQ
jgi:hypothetical protein